MKIFFIVSKFVTIIEIFVLFTPKLAPRFFLGIDL
jgi:hypothetical protein